MKYESPEKFINDLAAQILQLILTRLSSGKEVEIQIPENDTSLIERARPTREDYNLAIQEILSVLPEDFRKLVKVNKL